MRGREAAATAARGAAPRGEPLTGSPLKSSALVLLMSIPALALFYGGLVRTKNMLSLLMQVFMIVSVAALVWVSYGYSLAFTSGGPFIGGLSKAFLQGVDATTLAAARLRLDDDLDVLPKPGQEAHQAFAREARKPAIQQRGHLGLIDAHHARCGNLCEPTAANDLANSAGELRLRQFPPSPRQPNRARCPMLRICPINRRSSPACRPMWRRRRKALRRARGPIQPRSFRSCAKSRPKNRRQPIGHSRRFSNSKIWP